MNRPHLGQLGASLAPAHDFTDFGPSNRFAPLLGRGGEGGTALAASSSSSLQCVRKAGCIFTPTGCKHECLLGPKTPALSSVVLPDRGVIHFVPDGKTRAVCGQDVMLARELGQAPANRICGNCLAYLDRHPAPAGARGGKVRRRRAHPAGVGEV